MLYLEKGKVEFEDDATSTNLTSVKIVAPQPSLIKYGSFDPIILSLIKKAVENLQYKWHNFRNQETKDLVD